MVKRSEFKPAQDWIDALPKERLAQVQAGSAKIIASAHLAELRKSLDLTQVEVAERTGMKQGEISRLERAPETVQIRSMERYAAGLGGNVKLVVEFPGGVEAVVPVRSGKFVKKGLMARRVDGGKFIEIADGKPVPKRPAKPRSGKKQIA